MAALNPFDLIAENRYQAWLEAEQRGERRAQPAPTKTPSRKSFEAVIYEELIKRLERAAACDRDSERRARWLEQAASLEMRLMVAFERKDSMRLARVLAQSIRERRASLGLGDRL
ncbi:MAG: hypothetical protein CSB44_03430 [Gammaproteobacteria bacterium]|nr:MAG: hypothetical protein CSB44_03430 [Gammaproteobacteria bacterium]